MLIHRIPRRSGVAVELPADDPQGLDSPPGIREQQVEQSSGSRPALNVPVDLGVAVPGQSERRQNAVE